MTDVTKSARGGLARFNPETSKEKISVLTAAIHHAKQMQDWEAGWEAVDWLIEEQKKFVAWWDASVRRSGQPTKKELSQTAHNTLPVLKAEAKTKIKKRQVSRWRDQLARPTYRAMLFNPSHKRAMGDRSDTRAELQTGEWEWFTPAHYIEKARNVLGAIDLDPASCTEAQETVKAAKFYSFADDGLSQAWAGTVWLNPPYAGALVAAFAEKMVASWGGGTVGAAIMLTNAYTETSWFHALANASSAVCFTRGRIKFESPYGKKSAPTNGQSFFYFGNDVSLFHQHFADVGLIMVKAIPP